MTTLEAVVPDRHEEAARQVPKPRSCTERPAVSDVHTAPQMFIGASRGLTSAEAASRRLGKDRRRARRQLERPLRKHLRASLVERLLLLLLVVGAVYALLGSLRDAAIIFTVVVVVALIEAGVEWSAGRAIASLSALSAPRALVWRDQRLQEVAPEDLVRDDVIALTAGSRIPSDARLIEADELLVDESLVTGESQPVDRRPGNHMFSQLKAGTHVLRGHGTAVVTAIGRESSLGRVSAMVEATDAQQTPLQRQMASLTNGLLIAAVAVSVLAPLIGVIRGQPFRDMLLSALTLAVATIPAELPILLVIVLVVGSRRLAKRGAIVRRLSAAETLGATTLVCTDKTGTLTENQISLTSVVTASEVVESLAEQAGQVERVKQLARLASEAPSGQDSRLADPIDQAVRGATAPRWPEPIVRFSFDSQRRMASGLVHLDRTLVLGLKGAPEAVLVRALYWRAADGTEQLLDGDLRSRVIAAATRLTAGGARVLAIASRTITGAPPGMPSQLERDLVFEGLMAFSDPLRAAVPQAVRELLGAGVAVAMVTGDQPATAAAVAREAGLAGPTFIAAQTRGWTDAELASRATGGCVIARARPEDKLRLVRAAAASGHVVAVTGDGVNDAPALEAAAIGVAMGRSGSDVAREAADLVLADDNFATLASAAAEGRRLYENLRKALRYYLAVKLALVTVSVAMVLIGKPLPFNPVQIVILELLMDLSASIAFVNLQPESDVMRRKPRNPSARLIDRDMLAVIGAGGATLAALVGGAYLLALPSLGVTGARTLALVCWLIGHVALAMVMVWERRPLVGSDLQSNPALAVWAVIATALAIALLAVPSVATLLHAGPVPVMAGALAVVGGVVVPLWLEGLKRLRAGD